MKESDMIVSIEDKRKIQTKFLIGYVKERRKLPQPDKK